MASSSAPAISPAAATRSSASPRRPTSGSALAVAVPIILLARWYRDSRRGAQLRASREDELAARAIGIDVVRMRLGAWTVSAMICAAAGALLAHFLGAFSPSKFYFDDTLTLLTMLIVGGMTTVSGALCGAVLVTLTVEILRRVEGGVDLFGWQTPEMFGMTQAGLACMILLVMYRRPAGLFGGARSASVGCAPRRPAPHAGSDLSVAAAGELTIEAATKDFAGLRALDERERDACGRGRSSGLIGPNGSGKTTLLNLVSGVLVAERRAHPDRRRGCDPLAGAQGRAGRHRPHLPEHPPVRPSERAGECRDRGDHARGWLGRNPRAPWRGSCWRSSAWKAPPTGWRRAGLRRAAAAGDRARPGAAPALPAARRAGRRHEPDRIQPAAGRAGGAAPAHRHRACSSSITTCPSSCVSAIASWC